MLLSKDLREAICNAMTASWLDGRGADIADVVGGISGTRIGGCILSLAGCRVDLLPAAASERRTALGKMTNSGKPFCNAEVFNVIREISKEHRTVIDEALFLAAMSSAPCGESARELIAASGGDPKAIASITASIEAILPERQAFKRAEAKTPGSAPEPIPEPIRAFCRDLTVEAARNQLQPVLGREADIASLMRVLARSSKASAILVGDPGVGKTAVAEALAARIAAEPIGKGRPVRRIASLDLASLIAGAKAAGVLEQRLKLLVDTLEGEPDIVLFIDEAHVMVAGSNISPLIANTLKPSLASGRIRCIAATTHDEYARYFEADPAWSRRFQRVDLHELAPAAAVEVIEGVKGAIERHHAVTIDREAVVRAVSLTVRHLPMRRLPDKALDMIEEACSRCADAGRSIVGRADVDEAVGAHLGLALDGSAADLAERLRAAVAGHDEACVRIANTVWRARFGAVPGRGALCAIALVGPRGVGKDHLARTLAEVSDVPHHLVDLTEFGEAHAISRLIGSAPGYIGHEAGGRLTELLRKDPACVIHFENADRCHPNVAAVIAQAIRDGVIEDSRGRRFSTRAATFVLSVHLTSKRTIGFGGAGAETNAFAFGAFDGVFDETITLERLAPSDLATAARIACDRLSDQLTSEGRSFSAENEFLDLVVQRHLDPDAGMSAFMRDLHRTLDDALNEGWQQDPGASSIQLAAASSC